jgi:hypothetical protein
MTKNQPMSSKAFRVGGKGKCKKKEVDKASKKGKHMNQKEAHVPLKGKCKFLFQL